MAPVNDSFPDALDLAVTGGSGTQDMTDATGDPDPDVWFKVSPPWPARISFTYTQDGAGPFVDVWVGPDETDLDPVMSGRSPAVAGPDTVSFVAAAGTTYWIQMRQPGATMPTAVPYSWTVTQRFPELVLVIPDSEVQQAPAVLRVSVTNATPEGFIGFTIQGLPDWDFWVTADDTGVLLDQGVPLPALTAGTHILLATDDDEEATVGVEFTVVEDPDTAPTALAADAAPYLLPQTGVQRWVVQDPAIEDDYYVFPANPEAMTSPHPERAVTVESTIAPGGQPLTYEGAPKPYVWQFRGFTADEDFMAKLTALQNSPRRYYLVDHRKRAWTVTFEHLDAQPQIKPGLPWAHNYQMQCLIHSGPVQL